MGEAGLEQNKGPCLGAEQKRGIATVNFDIATLWKFGLFVIFRAVGSGRVVKFFNLFFFISLIFGCLTALSFPMDSVPWLVRLSVP